MKKRYHNLDIIKAVAAILIVFHHYQQIANVEFDGINFYGGSFYWGNLVELFFLISGFVMALSDKKGKSVFRKFADKCIRIYPSTILACSALIITVYAGYFLLGEFIHTSVDYSNIVTIISSYLLIFSGWFLNIGLGINNPTWYLCVLLLCYIIYYAIEVISEKTRINANIFYFLVFLISFIEKYFGQSRLFFFMVNKRGYVCFFLGVLLYNLIVKKFIDKQIWLAITGLAVITAIGIWRWGIGSWGVLVLFLFPLLILVAVNIRQLSIPILKTWGGASYQVYLWHIPSFIFLRLIGRLTGIQITHSYLTMVIFTIFVEIVALFIYKYYEIPVTKRLKGWLEARDGNQKER